MPGDVLGTQKSPNLMQQAKAVKSGGDDADSITEPKSKGLPVPFLQLSSLIP